LKTGGRVSADVDALLKNGAIKNPDGLVKLLGEIDKELAQKNAKGEDAPQYGKLRELQDAANRARAGHEVDLGKALGYYDDNDVWHAWDEDPKNKKPYAADVIDHKERLAIQKKVVTSPNRQNLVEGNIGPAIDQLAGKGGETPPPGYGKIADITLGEKAPLAGLDEQTIRAELKKLLSVPDRLTAMKNGKVKLRITTTKPRTTEPVTYEFTAEDIASAPDAP
jgi:hypothetical protein